MNLNKINILCVVASSFLSVAAMESEALVNKSDSKTQQVDKKTASKLKPMLELSQKELLKAVKKNDNIERKAMDYYKLLKVISTSIEREFFWNNPQKGPKEGLNCTPGQEEYLSALRKTIEENQVIITKEFEEELKKESQYNKILPKLTTIGVFDEIPRTKMAQTVYAAAEKKYGKKIDKIIKGIPAENCLIM